MMVVGLTGSIGMGKTSVANMLKELNVPVQDADAVVHELYTADEELIAQIGERFPETVKYSVVDRKALGREVAKDPEVLVWLENLVHPRVLRRQSEFLAQQAASGIDYAVLEIPLLFEKKDRSLFDLIVTVSSPADQQKERVLAREGMDREKFEYLLYRQWPDAKKREASDYVVENNGTLEELDRKSEKLAIHLLNESSKPGRLRAWSKWQAMNAEGF